MARDPDDLYEVCKSFSDKADAGAADSNLRLENLRSTVAKLEVMVQAMYMVMVDQGIDPELINSKVVDLVDNKLEVQHQTMSKPCPYCGKMVKESGKTPLIGRCLYCGKQVKFYPTFTVGEDKPAEENQ